MTINAAFFPRIHTSQSHRTSQSHWLLLAAALCGLTSALPAQAQSGTPAKPIAVPASASRPQPAVMPRRAAEYYELVWGIDSINVKVAESGELIRFSYRVLDPQKSAPLNDKKLTPSLIFPAGGIKLNVPSLEQVGQLRQSSTPKAGKSYWMAFSDPSRRVRRGDRIDIEIGPFRAEGLTVQ